MVKRIQILIVIALLLSFSACQMKASKPSGKQENKDLQPETEEAQRATLNPESDQKSNSEPSVNHRIRKLKDIPVKDYKGELTLKKLPEKCEFVLNERYGVGHEYEVDLTKGKADQNGVIHFPKKNVLTLFDFEKNKEIVIAENEGEYNYYGFCMDAENLYFVKAEFDKENSFGEWFLKEYHMDDGTEKIIDQGQFKELERFRYSEVDFGNKDGLFPRYVDASEGKLVYNKVTEEEGKLVFHIILYDIATAKSTVIAQGDGYIKNHLYSTAIDQNTIIYTKYHDFYRAGEQKERDTTYKYCDVYLYDIDSRKTEQLTKDDFIVHLDVSGGFISGVRYAPFSECGTYLDSAELVIYDTRKGVWKSYLSGRSNLGTPTFCQQYLVCRDFATIENLKIYNYLDNVFLDFSNHQTLSDFEIIDVTSTHLVVSKKEDYDGLYLVKFQ